MTSCVMTSLLEAGAAEAAGKTWHPLTAVVPPVLNELSVDELDELDIAEIYKGTLTPTL